MDTTDKLYLDGKLEIKVQIDDKFVPLAGITSFYLSSTDSLILELDFFANIGITIDMLKKCKIRVKHLFLNEYEYLASLEEFSVASSVGSLIEVSAKWILRPTL